MLRLTLLESLIFLLSRLIIKLKGNLNLWILFRGVFESKFSLRMGGNEVSLWFGASIVSQKYYNYRTNYFTSPLVDKSIFIFEDLWKILPRSIANLKYIFFYKTSFSVMDFEV